MRTHTRRFPDRVATITKWFLAGFMVQSNYLAEGQITNPSPIVLQQLINDGSPQRSTVTNLTLVFNTNVVLSPASFLIRKLTNGYVNPTNLAFRYDAANNKATWTFPGFPGGSLPDGNYTATLLANGATNASGNRLDGNADGRPGDSYTFGFFRYFGDYDGDRDVDSADSFWFHESYLKTFPDPLYDASSDVNGDGSVNATDLAAFNAHYFTLLPDQPAIFAALVNDTGLSPSDNVTSDPTIAGTVVQKALINRFLASLEVVPGDPNARFVDVTADLASDGTFWFTSNRLAQIQGAPLVTMPYTLHLETRDGADVVNSSFDLPFALEPACIFSSFGPWMANIGSPSSQSSNPVSGSVVFTNCEAILTEGDSFVTSLERTFTIPASAGLLAITYTGPAFDSSATNLMHDAFEAALVDSAGRPLTFTIQGSDGVTPAFASTGAILPASPDAFFNHSQSKSPFAAPGTAFLPLTPTAGFLTVACDIRHLPPGSSAKLILRLVNNDHDRATTVEIADVSFRPFDPTLDLSGSPPPAFSLIQGSATASRLDRDCKPNFSSLAAQVPKVVYGIRTTNVLNAPRQ
jgi:Dockerin type I domain